MSSTPFSQQRCFITGAASGIGRALAVALAEQGAQLVLTDIDTPALEAVVAQITRQGGQVIAYRALDIAQYEPVRQWAQELLAMHGSMDMVMNVAGIAIWGTVDKLTHRDWERSIAVNLMGPIHVIETLVPPMIRAGRGGRLVNVSSAAGLFGLPWHAAYSASKFGLRGISEVLRQDLRRHGIAVSLVCPGAVNTGLVESVQVAGVDMARPQIRALRAEFQAHAISPERAAQKILNGVQRKQALIFTSNDIRWGHWLARKWAWPYELAMRWLSDRLQRAAG
jgi:NAD(P)-dependent dehydrogenase (short-subunit alcohol dehydrogenase family)